MHKVNNNNNAKFIIFVFSFKTEWTLTLARLVYWTSLVKFVPRPRQQTQEISSLHVCFSLK
jgi:hypothetical protein